MLLPLIHRYAFLTTQDVKMAGRLQVLQNIFCNFVNWDELEVYKNEYPAILTEQAWSVRDLLHSKQTSRMTGLF